MQTFELVPYLERFRNINDGYPVQFFEVVERLLSRLIGNQSIGPWLAGGAPRRLLDNSQEEGDYDIFFKDEQSLNDCRCEIRNFQESGYIKELRESERDTNVTMTFKFRDRKITLQLIKFYFQDVEDIVQWFDFTICQCIVTRSVENRLSLHLGDFTAFDIARRRLVVNNLHHAVSSVRRLIKYAHQGYTACGGTISNILTRVVADPSIINQEVISVD